MPHPPSSESPRDRKRGVRERRESILVLLQSQPKSAQNLDQCLSRYPHSEKGVVEDRDNAAPAKKTPYFTEGPT